MDFVYPNGTSLTSLVVGSDNFSKAVPPSGGTARPINAVFEVAGPDGAFIYPTLTDDELAALDNDVTTVTSGLQAYNSDSETMDIYINGSGFITTSEEEIDVMSTNFTAAQINLIYDNPLVFIDSPGPDKYIDILSLNITVRVNGVSIYTNGGDLRVQYGDTDHGGGPKAIIADVPEAFIKSANPTFSVSQYYGALNTVLPDVEDQAIYISNTGEPFQNGNDVSIKICAYYRICEL